MNKRARICLNIIFQVCGKDITSKKYSFWRDLDSPNVYKSIQCDQALLVHVKAMFEKCKIASHFQKRKQLCINSNSPVISTKTNYCNIYSLQKSILTP